MCICLKLQQIGLLAELMANTAVSESDKNAANALIAEISVTPCKEFSLKTPTSPSSVTATGQ